MRSLSVLLPASLFVLASSTGAQNLPYPRTDTDTDTVSTVTVRAPAKTVRIWPDQAKFIAGAYAMSNGWDMIVKTGARHIDATIDDQQPLRLFAVAPYKFASADGNVNMEFNQGSWGEDVVMSYRPDPSLAQVIVISSDVAQR